MITQTLSAANLKEYYNAGAQIFYTTTHHRISMSTGSDDYRIFGKVVEGDTKRGFEAILTPSEFFELQSSRQKKHSTTTKEGN